MPSSVQTISTHSALPARPSAVSPSPYIFMSIRRHRAQRIQHRATVVRCCSNQPVRGRPQHALESVQRRCKQRRPTHDQNRPCGYIPNRPITCQVNSGQSTDHSQSIRMKYHCYHDERQAPRPIHSPVRPIPDWSIVLRSHLTLFTALILFIRLPSNRRPRDFYVPAIPLFCKILTTTRRFSAWPSDVAFGATCSEVPIAPGARMFVSGIFPFCSRNARTLSARSLLNF